MVPGRARLPCRKHCGVVAWIGCSRPLGVALALRMRCSKRRSFDLPSRSLRSVVGPTHCRSRALLQTRAPQQNIRFRVALSGALTRRHLLLRGSRAHCLFAAARRMLGAGPSQALASRALRHQLPLLLRHGVSCNAGHFGPRCEGPCVPGRPRACSGVSSTVRGP